MTLDEIAKALGLAPDPTSTEHGLLVLLDELRSRLSFRERCDASYTEGVQARACDLGIDVNPHHGTDYAIPWMLGWRAADEQAAVDELVVAARAATHDGRTAPLCTGGDQLREAVEKLLARQVSR